MARSALVVDRGVAMDILRSGAPLYDPVIAKGFSQDDAPTESRTLEHLQWTRATKHLDMNNTTKQPLNMFV